jgi:hypothetical protein
MKVKKARVFWTGVIPSAFRQEWSSGWRAKSDWQTLLAVNRLTTNGKSISKRGRLLTD